MLLLDRGSTALVDTYTESYDGYVREEVMDLLSDRIGKQ